MTLHTLANKFRSQLQSKRDTTAQSLTDAHAQTVQQIQPQLDETYKAIEAKQQAMDGNIPLSWLSEGGRLDALKQFVSEHIDQFSTFAKVTVQQVVDWAHSLAVQSATLFLKIVQPDTVVNPVSQSIVSKLLNGARDNLTGLFGTFGKNAAQGIEKALKLGLVLGDKISVLDERIKTVLDEPRWRSIAIAATELFRMFNDGLMSNYQVNAHVVIGWQWQCKLSPHSCACCVAMHGTIHKLTETLEDHVNGECQPLPYFSGQELGQSGTDWFAEQDEKTQRAILSTNVAYDLWKSGQATLQDFIGIRHDPGYEPSVYQKSVKQIKQGK
jgi:hypothetical protein